MLNALMASFRSAWTNRHLLSLAGRGATAVLRLVSFALLARLLGPAGLGGWILYRATASFLHMCRNGLTKTPLVREIAAAAEAKHPEIIGSGWGLSVLLTAFFSLAVALLGLLPYTFGALQPFVVWYPLLAWTSLPLHIGVWLGEATDRFDRVLGLNLLRGAVLPMVVVLLADGVVDPSGAALSVTNVEAGLRALDRTQGVTVADVCMWHALLMGGASAFTVVLRWSSVRALPRMRWDGIVRLYRFGRYSAGTLIGTHLLTSSDTYILTAIAGPAAVGVYGVAQKAIRVIMIPVRALSATAYPVLASMTSDDPAAVPRYVHRWTLALTIAIAPVLAALGVFASNVVAVLGGPSFVNTPAAAVLLWFIPYLLLVPVDRMMGMLFDSLQRPELNLKKVTAMLGVNIVGDALALLVFGTVEAVAAVTTLTMIAGVVAGQKMLPSWVRFSGTVAGGTLRRAYRRLRQRLRAGTSSV